LGLPEPTRLSVAEASPPLLLVDRVGILAQLYGAGTMAYVGGGFGRAGLHSVLEPAAWSLPVAFGPRWQNSRDASLLLNAGAAVALPLTRHAAARALHSTWEGWLGDEAGRQAQGRQAREVVESGMGASDRTAAMLDDLISQRRPQRSSHEARSAPL
jgi:3-deoxy-D-manno-octulosonic-acid transferase